MTKRLLFAVVVLLWTFGTNAQLFNPLVTRPFTGVFDNGGAPFPFFNQVAAVNYNYGGQGIGYKVPSPSCVGVTCVAGASTYRADAVNFKSSTFGSGFNFQLGFGLSPNAWNYTISITQAGPYTITLWTGSASAGGSWNVLIDNVVVGNVVTPNTGDYATLAASTSPSFNATLGTHILTLAWASGDGAGASGDIVAWQGQVASTPAFVSTSIDCGSGCAYTSGAASGTSIGNASAVLSSGSFSGTWSTSGAAAADFTFAGNQLQTNGATPTCTSTTALNLNIVATQAGVTGSPSSKAITVTCNPPGTTIACDYGPPYTGVIPAGASAAGFTHCAVNLDYGNSRFASLSNWIDCFGASGPANTPILNQIDGVAGNNVPCDGNHYAMVADGPYSQVFKATWLNSDSNHNNNLWSTYSRNGVVYPAYSGFTMPNGHFIEWTWRASPQPTCASHGCLTWAPFEYRAPQGDPNTFIEYDYGELYEGTNGNGTGCVIQSNANSPIYMPVCDPGNYHTYGYRITADGNDNIAMCNYYSATPVNGLPASSFSSCLSTSKSGISNAREGVFPTWGPFGADVAAGFFGSTPSFSILQVRLTIWACNGWEGPNEHSNVFTGAQCNGTILTSAP